MMYEDNAVKEEVVIPLYVIRGEKKNTVNKVDVKKSRTLKYNPDIAVHIVLVMACLLTCFPVLFALVKATQVNQRVISASLIPGPELIKNIKIIFAEYGMGRYMLNSFCIAVIVTGGKIILSLLAANALVFYDFKGRKLIMGLILGTLMLPSEILILGLFDVVSLKSAGDVLSFAKWLFNPKEFWLEPVKYGLGLGDTAGGIILPFLASATGVFLFYQHFMSIPKSLADSVRIDGANSFQFLFHVLIPMSRNTIGALSLIEFIYVWNQYIWPRIIIRQNDNQVIQVGLNALTSAGDSIQWNLVMTGSIIAMIPPLIVFALLYKSFMNGYALTSNK